MIICIESFLTIKLKKIYIDFTLIDTARKIAKKAAETGCYGYLKKLVIITTAITTTNFGNRTTTQ